MGAAQGGLADWPSAAFEHCPNLPTNMSVVGSVARLLPCQARQAPAPPPYPPEDGLHPDLEVQFNYLHMLFFVGSAFAAAQPIEIDLVAI